MATAGNRTIYVRESDAELWERAERYAAARRLSMSALIMSSLERFLDDENPAPSAGERPRDDA